MSKKYLIIVAVISVVFIICQSGLAVDYDLKVHETMIKLKVAVKTLEKHAKSKNYFAAAEKFMDIARFLKGLSSVDPQKHSKREWDTIHETIINTAFQGVGACERKDDQAVRQAIEDILASMSRGHKIFR